MPGDGSGSSHRRCGIDAGLPGCAATVRLLADREWILQTAVQLFGERGVDVPLDEIAAASGIGSATLHRQFRGRVELVYSVLDTQADRLAARAAELLSSGCPGTGTAGMAA